MGNASPGGKQQKGEGGHLPDCVAGTGWSEEDASLFERLLSHWQVGEGELQPADDVPSLTVAGRTKFEDQVSVVRWRGDLLVLKRCQPPSALYQELAVWFRLRPHTRVVGFRGVVPGSAAVLTDYMPLGTLETFVLSPDAPPPGSPAWLRQGVSLLLDVARAMAHLHAEGFVWRDCAARNVLLCHEGGHDRLLRGKITDFGFARRMDADGRVVVPAQTRNLPIRIGAPESLVSDDAEYSAKSDVWSFGVLIYSLFARKRPYGDLAPAEVVQGVIAGSLSLNADDLVLHPSPSADSGKKTDKKTTSAPTKEKKKKMDRKRASGLRSTFEACQRRRPQDRPTMTDVILALSHHHHQLASPPSPQQG